MSRIAVQGRCLLSMIARHAAGLMARVRRGRRRRPPAPFALGAHLWRDLGLEADVPGAAWDSYALRHRAERPRIR